MRKLATVQRIKEIKSIEGADKICAYRVLDWWVVDSINKYKVGDLVLYIEIDSWIPNELAPFLSKGNEPREYEGIKGERLRTVKLKKQISQGLILPLPFVAEEGDDVSELLGIIKWEPPISTQLQGNAKGNFPSYLRKTDQDRIENIAREVFVDNKDQLFEVTAKLDGSSASFYFYNGTVGVCSRNLELKIDETNQDNSFVRIANSTHILDALRKLELNIQVSGELCGPGINGNHEKFTENKLFIFDIFDIDKQRYVSSSERAILYKKLQCFGYTGDHVPIINALTKLSDIGIVDVASSKVYVDRPSIINNISEGCVFKREDGQFSFKSINNKYLLKYE